MKSADMTAIEEDLEQAAYRLRICLAKMALSQVNDGEIPERYQQEYVHLLAKLHTVVARARGVIVVTKCEAGIDHENNNRRNNKRNHRFVGYH